MAKKSVKKSVKKKTKKAAAAVKGKAKPKAKRAAKKASQKKPVKKTLTKSINKTAQKTVAKPASKSIKPSAKVDYSKAITPLGNRLVVRQSASEKVTAGGIIIPQTSVVSGHIRGTVLAVGHGEKNKKGHIRPLDVQKGDEVLFSEFAGTKVVFNSEELIIIQESDVLGIVQ